MPEPTGANVATYTQGRLGASDPLTIMLLAGALSAARRYCGWHVVGEETEDLILDGPGEVLLILPTKKLTAINTLSERGESVDVSTLKWSRSGQGLVSRPGHCWTSELGGIAINITHGYTDAPDFNLAVLSMVDRLAEGAANGTLRVIGPFQYGDTTKPSEDERIWLDNYALGINP